MSHRRLWLVRHAKSDWQRGVPDFERDLNARGRRDGPIMAEWLSHQPCPAQWIWSSTAVRALATARAIATGWHLGDDDVIGVDALYLAPPEIALDTLRDTPPDIESVALVFHNPGITALVNLLAGRDVIDNLPTLGIVEFSTSLRWPGIHPGAFRLERIVSPKALRTI